MKNIIKVGAILKNINGEVLIFKEYSNKKYRFLYNIPKGTVGDNDKTLTDAIKREIYEETNINNIEILNTLNIYIKTNKKENYNSVLVLFEVLSFDENISNKNILGNENITNYYWINLKDFEKISKDDFMDERIYLSVKKYFKDE